MKRLAFYLMLAVVACSSSGGPSGPNDDEPRGEVNGNVATFDGISMTLTAHLEPWTDWEFDFMAPDPGHHYYTVMPLIVNGSDAQITVNSLDWTLEYNGNTRVDRAGHYREPDLALTNLLPQQQLTGWLVFQVPDGGQVTAIHWSPVFDVSLELDANDIP